MDSMRLSVLVVEDEALVAMNLTDLILELGCEPTGIAASASQAIAMAAAGSPDIAFVDLNLLDGCKGAEVARRLADDHGTFVIVVSANPEHVREGAGGVQLIVRKPYLDDAIVEGLRWARSQVLAGARLASV